LWQLAILRAAPTFAVFRRNRNTGNLHSNLSRSTIRKTAPSKTPSRAGEQKDRTEGEPPPSVRRKDHDDGNEDNAIWPPVNPAAHNSKRSSLWDPL